MNMLKPNRQPKIQRTLPIPERLRNAMIEMSRLILHKDSSTLEISDDGMQDENLVVAGGLVDKEKKIFDFTYYTPESDAHAESGDNPDQVWGLRLTEEEIHTIADGTLKELSLWTCADAACVHAEHEANFTCFRCDYYDDGRTVGYAQYVKA